MDGKMPKTTTVTEQEIEQQTTTNRGWVVVVFNDDVHTFEYVMHVFCTILLVSAEKAGRMAYNIHTQGQEVVAGPMSRYEAEEIVTKIRNFGPDPWAIRDVGPLGCKAEQG
jgi:ATP-dependent Clp protease adapter protein ClpS